MSQTLTAPALTAHLGDPWRLAEMLDRPDVLCTGHYRLLSGLHSDRFLRFSRLAADRQSLSYIADLLTGVVAAWQPEVVIAPTTAGVSLGGEIGRRLCIPLHLAAVGDDGRATGLIGDPAIAGERVLLVNDVITTGQGLTILGEVVKAAGGLAIGCTAFLGRTGGDLAEAVQLPAAVVASAVLAAWTEDRCPLCSQPGAPEDAVDLN